MNLALIVMRPSCRQQTCQLDIECIHLHAHDSNEYIIVPLVTSRHRQEPIRHTHTHTHTHHAAHLPFSPRCHSYGSRSSLRHSTLSATNAARATPLLHQTKFVISCHWKLISKGKGFFVVGVQRIKVAAFQL